MSSYNRAVISPSPPQRQGRTPQRQRLVKNSMGSDASRDVRRCIPVQSKQRCGERGHSVIKGEESASLSGCIAELKKMAAAHKKIGDEFYLAPHPPQEPAFDRGRKIRKNIRNETPGEVGDIIESLRKCRHEPVPHFSFRDSMGRRMATPTNRARPPSNARNRSKGGKLKSAHGSFVDPTLSGKAQESRRYRSSLRGQQQNMELAGEGGYKRGGEMMSSSQAYGRIEFEPTREMCFDSRKNSSARIEAEEERLTQMKNAYNIKDPHPREELLLPGQNLPKSSDVGGHIRTKCSKSCSRGSNKVSAGSQKIELHDDSSQYKGSVAAGQRRLVTTFNECTYGKDTTKSSDKTSMMHTKGSIKNGGKSSLNMSYTQCVDTDSISFNGGVSVITQINSAMGKAENQSVEDIHFYFVAFYQRTKKMLSRVELGPELDEDKTPKKASRVDGGEREEGENSIVLVEENEDDEMMQKGDDI